MHYTLSYELCIEGVCEDLNDDCEWRSESIFNGWDLRMSLLFVVSLMNASLSNAILYGRMKRSRQLWNGIVQLLWMMLAAVWEAINTHTHIYTQPKGSFPYEVRRTHDRTRALKQCIDVIDNTISTGQHQPAGGPRLLLFATASFPHSFRCMLAHTHIYTYVFICIEVLLYNYLTICRSLALLPHPFALQPTPLYFSRYYCLKRKKHEWGIRALS